MDSDHKRHSTTVAIAFLAVYLLWGATFLAVRYGVESFPPLLLGGTRHLITGLVFYPILRWKTGIRPTLQHWVTCGITGILLLGVGNGGVCWAEQTVPSGIAALLVAMVTLWMVVVDWVRPGGRRPSARVILGVLVGFVGMAMLVGPSRLGAGARIDPVGAGVLAVGSLAWACGSIYAKHGRTPGSAMLSMAMQCLSGGMTLWIVGLLTGEARALHLAGVSPKAWLAIFYLVVFGSGIGFTAYIYILKNSTAARVATYAFVNPVVALFLGWLIAGEELTGRTILAALVILGAVVLVITAPAENKIEAERTVAVPSEA